MEETKTILCLSIKERQEEILRECDNFINEYSNRANKYKKSYKILTNMSIILGATVAILSAIPLISDLNWPITLVAVISTLCTTLLTTTRSQSLWVLSRDVQHKLDIEKLNFKLNLPPYKDLSEEEKIEFFSKNVIIFRDEAYKNWKQTLPNPENKMQKMNIKA